VFLVVTKVFNVFISNLSHHLHLHSAWLT